MLAIYSSRKYERVDYLRREEGIKNKNLVSNDIE